MSPGPSHNPLDTIVTACVCCYLVLCFYQCHIFCGCEACVIQFDGILQEPIGRHSSSSKEVRTYTKDKILLSWQQSHYKDIINVPKAQHTNTLLFLIYSFLSPKFLARRA